MTIIGYYVSIGIILATLDLLLSKFRANQWIKFEEFAAWVLAWPFLSLVLIGMTTSLIHNKLANNF